MRLLMLRLIAAITIGQIIATAIPISMSWLYWKLFESEAWSALLPSLALALVVESYVILLVSTGLTSLSKLKKVAISVLASWGLGIAAFLLLDGFALDLRSQAPKIAWFASLVAAVWLAKSVIRKFEAEK